MSIRILLSVLLLWASSGAEAQYVGEVWKGRVGEPGPGRTWEVELKLDVAGDSVKGVSYYRGAYYRELRMPVKGYVDPRDGSLLWWHASEYGTDLDGKVALDPMPPGIRYKLSQKKASDTTQSLEGKVSMSLWSGEKWERDVLFVRASSDRSAEWETVVSNKPKSQPTAKTSPKPVDTKSSSAKTSQPKAATVREKPTTPAKTEPAPKPEAVKTAAKSDVAKAVPEKPKVNPTPPPAPKKVEKKADTASLAARKPPTPKPAAVKSDAPPKPSQSAVVKKESGSPKAVAKNTDAEKTAKKTRPVTLPKTTETAMSTAPAKSESILPSEPMSKSAKMPPLRSRERILVDEVVVHGDTLWLNFYDPAEVDGDTVSVYLGDAPIATGIGLGLQPHVIGIPVVSLPDSAELTMFAENMGSIPPNTSLLVLYVAGERREVRLESSDRASATVRFLRPSPPKRL
jgi:hypothetical protein